MVEIINPDDIENALSQIWDSFQGTNKMRACLFNLIIYAEADQRNAYLNQIAQKVIEKFPSRIIFITYNKKYSDHKLHTKVSILTADEGKSEIACDLIEVNVYNRDHPIIPFIILPHILPDLPVYLVHADDLSSSNPVAEQLEHFANRIIFDSETTLNLPVFAQAVLNHNNSSHADVADLNWARIEGWRQLFSNVFKPLDDLNHLQQANIIHIQYNSKKTDYLFHTNIQAIYLQSWVAVQLGWNLKKIEKKTTGSLFIYQTNYGKLQVFLHPSNIKEISPGRILFIEIKTQNKTTYTFRRNTTCSHHIVIEKSTENMCSLPVYHVLDKDESGQSLVKEICHKGTSTHYIKMLKFLAQIKNKELSNE